MRLLLHDAVTVGQFWLIRNELQKFVELKYEFFSFNTFDISQIFCQRVVQQSRMGGVFVSSRMGGATSFPYPALPLRFKTLLYATRAPRMTRTGTYDPGRAALRGCTGLHLILKHTQDCHGSTSNVTLKHNPG